MSREDQILTAATQLFSERSFDGVGVDAIAGAAGITGSAVYRHFSSKEEILAVLFDRLLDALLVRIGEPTDSPEFEIERLIAAHVEFTMENPELTIIWNREQTTLSQVYRANIMRRKRAYVDRWIRALGAGYPGRTREELASAVRAVHSLISSDTSRPGGAKRPSNIAVVLSSMARASLGALADGYVSAVAGATNGSQ
ncbi:TetR/AcrR family transcriptional regulator [Rhodococcus sp. T7]|uniref:TetR/AcrR family transcriptional regulator n=1 Tax=Rhodococcus sp. T7 TaxID=627444 RepID=UPI001357171D|nr:TetR/AcrR family transcriptional regulator [Rhodococcus sp. T7]KAF0957149.1 hypothetical protein MLGJGCBP_08979 [Rhodococcus sp. T7]KAF0963335.1 hypothetical protein MLGJGCBP_03539 [Rhodococcus sp. T7]